MGNYKILSPLSFLPHTPLPQICALDTDKTGRVELGEFQEVCTKLNFGYDDAYVKRLYYWYDYDRHPAGGHVDLGSTREARWPLVLRIVF